MLVFTSSSPLRSLYVIAIFLVIALITIRIPFFIIVVILIMLIIINDAITLVIIRIRRHFSCLGIKLFLRCHLAMAKVGVIRPPPGLPPPPPPGLPQPLGLSFYSGVPGPAVTCPESPVHFHALSEQSRKREKFQWPRVVSRMLAFKELRRMLAFKEHTQDAANTLAIMERSTGEDKLTDLHTTLEAHAVLRSSPSLRAPARLLRNLAIFQAEDIVGFEDRAAFVKTLTGTSKGKDTPDNQLASQLLLAFRKTLGELPGAFRSKNSKRPKRPRRLRPQDINLDIVDPKSATGATSGPVATCSTAGHVATTSPAQQRETTLCCRSL